MMPSRDNVFPIHLNGINATLILYPQKMVFRLKGHIYPLRYAKPLEKWVSLIQVAVIDHQQQPYGGNLIITLDDNSLMALLYTHHEAEQAHQLHQMLVGFLHNQNNMAGTC